MSRMRAVRKISGHDAVALALAEQLRRVVHERRVMISEKRLGHTTTVP